jgi:hypothetical protein
VGLAATGVLLMAGAVVAAVTMALWPAPPTPATHDQPGPAREPLRGWVDVRVWKKGETDRPGLRLHQGGALPLKAGDALRMEVELNRPAYLYVIQLVASGEAVPQYPWRDYDWHKRPADERTRARWSFPAAEGTGAPLDPGPSGVESILLLVREEKLPADADDQLKEQFADLPKQKRLVDARLAAWFENGNLVTTEEDRGKIRLDQEQAVGDMVLRTQLLLRDRLGPQFSYTRAVCYGFQGK